MRAASRIGDLARGWLSRLRDAFVDHWLGYLIAGLLAASSSAILTSTVASPGPCECVTVDDLVELSSTLRSRADGFSRLHISEAHGLELCFHTPDATVTSSE